MSKCSSFFLYADVKHGTSESGLTNAPSGTSTGESSHTIDLMKQKQLLDLVGGEVKSELTDPEFAKYVSESLLTLGETKKHQELECEKAKKEKAFA